MKEPQGCIYHVVNKKNGKGYVGKYYGLDVEHRWQGHLNAARYGSKYAFHCALRKYKYEKGFTWEVVWCGALSLLNKKEAYYIKNLRTHTSFGAGYNLTWGGEGCVLTGRPLKQRNKAIKAAWVDPAKCVEHGKKLRAVFSAPEQRAARSEARRTEWADPVYRAKMLKIRREKPGRLGKHNSPEQRELAALQVSAWWSAQLASVKAVINKKRSVSAYKAWAKRKALITKV
jgi:hypothetical protein